MAHVDVDPKDPDAVLDYVVNWATWLDGDTISTSAFTVPAGITKDSESNTTTTATVWLSGGTAGTWYAILNRITTAAGRTNDQTIYVQVKEQ